MSSRAGPKYRPSADTPRLAVPPVAGPPPLTSAPTRQDSRLGAVAIRSSIELSAAAACRQAHSSRYTETPPTRVARSRYPVLIPKFPPPPPWQAHIRSGWDRALTRSTSPHAVTTSVASSWSQVRPMCRLLNPNPPPSSSPLTATEGHRPPGVATPVPARAAYRSRFSAPGPSRIVSDSRSTRTQFIRASEMTSPAEVE